jgi:hypothetical protein
MIKRHLLNRRETSSGMVKEWRLQVVRPAGAAGCADSNDVTGQRPIPQDALSHDEITEGNSNRSEVRLNLPWTA